MKVSNIFLFVLLHIESKLSKNSMLTFNLSVMNFSAVVSENTYTCASHCVLEKGKRNTPTQLVFERLFNKFDASHLT